MSQMSIFDGSQPLKITKPIRLIECFAGYGSQALALKYLGVDFEHWKIAEWAVKSIQAYKDMHFPEDNTDYSAEHSKEWLIDFLFDKCISADYNKPMTREQIARMGEDKIRTVYNNIVATNNLVSVCGVSGKDLEITYTDKYDYILTYSFPCQDLSQAGLSKGMKKGSGTRSGLLWEIERILDECEELPQILLMENVPQVIGEKNRDAFRDWFMKLESLGYKSWYTIMNGKDYEIPQNRERCFMVSALGDCYYDFPEKTGCKLRLKDLLQKDVGQEYYLSDSLIEYFERHTVESKEKGNGFKFEPTDGDCIGKCVTTRAGGRMDDNFIRCDCIGMLTVDKWDKCIDSARRVYSADQAAPTLTTCGGGNQEVKIAVPSAVACGYEYAESGDSINLSYPNSKSRRGRVGHQVAQTLLTQNEIAVVEQLEPKVLGGIGEKKSNGGTQWYQQDRIYDDNCAISVTTAFNPYYKVEQEEIRVFDAYNNREIGGDAVGTNCTNAGARQAGVFWVKKPNARVRKLTERECFRLMGVKDEDFDRVSKNQSKSSLYHLAGDSIITNCLMAIFKEML